eukprot:CAMPEP_0180624238 /NCGR_PEP_ID=MMETSP1037_2-20121125/36665_1 /TAXON_ID=632150 /ORGANISM="Azadinium spinosum, Strain 3D9" /LENGTH=291 /DNA_ID=CAMNT_0022644647 /DNA_START=66 /DNA_END=940 /DNA_ORIENTATION=-
MSKQSKQKTDEAPTAGDVSAMEDSSEEETGEVDPMVAMMAMMKELKKESKRNGKKLDRLEAIEASMTAFTAKIAEIEATLSRHEQDFNDFKRQLEDARKESADLRALVVGGGAGSGTGGVRHNDKTYKPLSERTCVVVGGFPEETPRAKIDHLLNDIKGKIKGVTSTWSPSKRGSIGKLNFDSPSSMWEWIKSMKGKKIEHDGVSHWFCVEKSKTERDLARLVSRAMKILREALDKEGVDTADKDILDADWNRGVVWVRGTKVLMRTRCPSSPLDGLVQASPLPQRSTLLR